jgi:hypothetical protein
MTEKENNNYKLAGTLSTVGAIMFVVGFVLCQVSQNIGGLLLILSFFASATATILGITSKHTRAIVVGAIPTVMVLFFLFLGLMMMR